LGREIKKVNKKVYDAQVGCELCNRPHYIKIVHLKKEKHLKKHITLNLVYHSNKVDNIEQQLHDSTKETMRTLRIKSEDKQVMFMAESAKIHEGNSNLIMEIRAATNLAIINQGALIKALEIQIQQMHKVLQVRGSGSLPSLTETNLRDHVKSISTTVETDMLRIRHIRPIRYAASSPQKSKLFFMPSRMTIPFPSRLNDDCYDEEEGSYGLKYFDAYSIGTTLLDDALPPKEKVTGSFTLPCIINNLCFNKALADLGASVSVMPFSTYTKLGLGELAPTKLIVELADRTMKRPKGIEENVLVGINKFVFLVDFIVLDMPEDIKTPLILGRPFLSTAHAKINVFKRNITLRIRNDKVVFESDKSTSNIIKRVYALNLNEPLELRRNQVDDLEPTIEEGEVVDEPMMDIVKTRCDNEIIDGLCYEYVNSNFFHLLCINLMSKTFYNSIIKDKVEYKGKNVVGAFLNIPIFVGNFSVVIDSAVFENMDAYRDDGMGDVIVGRPFYKEACVKASGLME
ncbi:ribonuclease H-like domain, reverse transcriptase, RNA-dependent DNA polymerase, partial [Tanacetum coccineum]